MSAERTQFQKAVLRRVDEVLHTIWDPIGISEIPEARDEYQSYVPKVAEFLFEQKKKEELEAYLHWLAIQHIGLSDTAEGRIHTKKVVDILFDDLQRMQKEPIQLPETTRGK
jgi:hypothetical protein